MRSWELKPGSALLQRAERPALLHQQIKGSGAASLFWSILTNSTPSLTWSQRGVRSALSNATRRHLQFIRVCVCVFRFVLFQVTKKLKSKQGKIINMLCLSFSPSMKVPDIFRRAASGSRRLAYKSQNSFSNTAVSLENTR